MIQLEQIEFDDIARGHFQDCQGDFFTLSDMELEVETGVCKLYGAFYDGKRFGSLMTRKDGAEYVVVTAGGATVEGSTFEAVLPHVKKLAQETGCLKVRAHTFDQAKVKLMEKAGFVLSEYILRTDV